jgi:cytochrome P450
MSDVRAAVPVGIRRTWRSAVRCAIAAGIDPNRYLRDHLSRDGDPFRVWFPGLGNVLFTASPEGARDIFQAPPELLAPPRPNPVEPLLGAGSLILLAGDRHRRERKLMMPPFHGERMRAYARVIQDASLREISRWSPGQPVHLQRSAQAITLDVIIAAIFGVHDRARQAAYARVIASLLGAYSPALLLVPALRRSFGGIGPWSRFAALRTRFDKLLTEEIVRRRRAAGEDDDILSLLLAARYDDGTTLSDDDLLDELRTLLVAGHETTSTSLAWALFHLHREPGIRDRLDDELRPMGDQPAPDAMAQLPYLGAICHEALRLHPVVPIVLRRVAGSISVVGVDVHAGDTVGVAVSLLHANREIWPEPERFIPERFLDRKYSPFEYAPFGGGHRRCIGAAFAAYEMRIVLGTVMAHARLALAERDRRRPLPTAVPKSITLGPRRDLMLTYVERR